jgi:hypothetical protein
VHKSIIRKNTHEREADLSLEEFSLLSKTIKDLSQLAADGHHGLMAALDILRDSACGMDHLDIK